MNHEIKTFVIGLSQLQVIFPIPKNSSFLKKPKNLIFYHPKYLISLFSKHSNIQSLGWKQKNGNL